MKSFQWSKIIENVKNKKKEDWVVLLLLGALVLILTIPTQKSTLAKDKEEKSRVLNWEQDATSDTSLQLEERLENILSCMEGVGKVEVMISGTKESERKMFASNQECNQVNGVVIVAQGADDAKVCQRIMNAVMSLFGIDAHKITIVKMSAAEEAN